MMTAIALPQLKGDDQLTHSRMACAKSCLRKHYYRYEMGLRPERQSQPLRMGSAFHLGLDLMAQGKTVDDAAHLATASYDEPPAWVQSDDDMHAWEVERVVVMCLLRGYDAVYGPVREEIIATEQAFSMPLIDPDTGRPSRWSIAG